MWARFEDIHDMSILERIMQVNYMGAVYCTHHALPHLRESQGRIVGISSLAGKVGVPTRTGYSAAKHAMTGFFDSLRIELDDSGVTVTMIYPGFVATGIRENATGPDGKPILVSPVKEGEVMSVEECARRIVQAIERREREVVMTARGKIGLWLKLIAPVAHRPHREAGHRKGTLMELSRLAHLPPRDDRPVAHAGAGRLLEHLVGHAPRLSPGRVERRRHAVRQPASS